MWSMVVAALLRPGVSAATSMHNKIVDGDTCHPTWCRRTCRAAGPIMLHSFDIMQSNMERFHPVWWLGSLQLLVPNNGPIWLSNGVCCSLGLIFRWVCWQISTSGAAKRNVNALIVNWFCVTASWRHFWPSVTFKFNLVNGWSLPLLHDWVINTHMRSWRMLW